MPHSYYRNRIIIRFTTCTVHNIRIFRPVVVDKMEHESDEKSFVILPTSLPTSVITYQLVIVAVSVRELPEIMAAQR